MFQHSGVIVDSSEKKKKECADPFTNESWACCFMLSKERIELCFSKGIEPDGRGVTHQMQPSLSKL